MRPPDGALFPLFKEAAERMWEDRVSMMGAALAFYTLFSIAPLLVIALGVIGTVFGEGSGAEVFATIESLVGENGAMAIEGLVEGAAARPDTGKLAAAAGVLMLVVGASGVFVQLQDSLNLIWKVAPKDGAGIKLFLHRRLLSFAMVGVIAFMLLVSLLASAGLSAVGSVIGDRLPGGAVLWQSVNISVSLAVIALMFALIFKVLPDARVRWGDAFVGGAFTALLFSLGKYAIGAYLGKSGAASAYGAAGSLVVVLLWVFYSSQLVLFGAEFTRAYGARGGKAPPPRAGAAKILDCTRAARASRAAAQDE